VGLQSLARSIVGDEVEDSHNIRRENEVRRRNYRSVGKTKTSATEKKMNEQLNEPFFARYDFPEDLLSRSLPS